MSTDELTAHGRLLEEARGALSQRKAAKLAGISDARWRQIVRGRQPVGSGLTVEVTTKPATLIAMARAVGADAAEVLRAAGFDVVLSDEEQPPTDDALERFSDEQLLGEVLRRMQRGTATQPSVTRLPTASEGRALRKMRLQEEAMPQTEAAYDDEFDGVTVGRAAAAALVAAGYSTLSELPADLGKLDDLHDLGPAAIRRLEAARAP